MNRARDSKHDPPISSLSFCLSVIVKCSMSLPFYRTFLTKLAASTSDQTERNAKLRPMLDQVLIGDRSRPLPSGHLCRSNLWAKYRSAITASLAN